MSRAFNVYNQALYHIINAMSNQLIYIKLLRHYIMFLQCGDVLLISIGQNMMTKSKNVLANKPRVIINNSMSTNRAAKCHNVADISKE